MISILACAVWLTVGAVLGVFGFIKLLAHSIGHGGSARVDLSLERCARMTLRALEARYGRPTLPDRCDACGSAACPSCGWHPPHGHEELSPVFLPPQKGSKVKVNELRKLLKACPDQEAEILIRIADEEDPDEPRGRDEEPEDFIGFVIGHTHQSEPGPYLILETEPADDEEDVGELTPAEGDDEGEDDGEDDAAK